MNVLRLLVFAALLLPLAPCQALQTPDAEYEAVAEEYIKGFLAARPMQAVALGFHEFDGKTADYSRLALDAELTRLRRFDDRLKIFDLDKLGARQSIDLRILQSSIKREIFERQEMGMYERNPMVYARAADVSVYLNRSFAAIEDRLHSIVMIEAQIPNVLIAAKTNLDPVLPKPYVELAIQVARGSADFLRTNLVQAVKDVKDERIRTEFLDINRKAVAALSEYAGWLEREKLPKASPDFALGEEKYHRMLAETEMVDLTPEAVLELGMAKLKEEQDAFAKAAQIIDPDKTPVEVFKAIQKEHPPAEGLIPEVSKNLEQVRKYVVAHKIVTIPSDVRAQVRETPQYRRATSFASMDTPGAFEKRATEAFFYVTPVEPDWPDKQKEEWLTSFNNYSSDLVSIHEAYPGHYVQFLRLNASPATKVEKLFRNYSFVEGWAHYCEQMMIDQGYGAPASKTPSPEEQKRAAKYRMAQADLSMLRLCRLCSSIKMHTQNMSVDDATKFFQDNCYYEEKPARSEAMRGTFDPGYLSYTLGKLQILKLRSDYEAQQGKEFSLLKFHNELLNHGTPPVRLLREIMLKDKAKWGDVL
jgi:uncharacterized protein (DUF885 family)